MKFLVDVFVNFIVLIMSARKSAGGRSQKLTDREKRLRKVQQVRNERCSLPE